MRLAPVGFDLGGNARLELHSCNLTSLALGDLSPLRALNIPLLALRWRHRDNYY